jgi:hypothetical protein
MWNLLKRAGDYFVAAAPANPLQEFSESCRDAIRVLQAGPPDPAKLSSSLGAVATLLKQGLSRPDSPCFNYFIENAILAVVADSISAKLSPDLVEPVLQFVLKFFGSDLNGLLDQRQVHRPVAALLAKLDILDRKSPRATREFAADIWKSCVYSPIVVELLASGGSYPILDFIAGSIWTWSPLNDGAFRPRDIVFQLFVSQGRLSQSFGRYICDRLFPKFCDFLVSVLGCVETFQFTGRVTALVDWFDELLMIAPPFPIDRVLAFVAQSLTPAKRHLSLSWLLSHFAERRLNGAVLAFCLRSDFIGELASSLADLRTAPQALVLLKQLVLCPPAQEMLFPPPCVSAADVLSLLPLAWIVECDGPAGPDAYAADASVRIQALGTARPAGTDRRVFDAVLELLGRFADMPVRLCLSVTQLVAIMIAIAPDLINAELAGACRRVVEALRDVGDVRAEAARCEDSPRARAAVFAEFAKEIHGTFIAAEQLALTVALFDK